jgi:bisphosphoglycerate-independent phosphoglycerate mutase (AlkP superfamily)
MHILMIFLDGIGLGADDPLTNPFAAAHTPTLIQMANGHRWLATTGIQHTARTLFIPTDPRMGVEGRPQSGTGQAAIVTGLNVPSIIGEHYGPKPNQAVRDLIAQNNFFKQVITEGKRAALLEAYPPRWHQAVNSGKMLRSSYQQAAYEAGLALFDEQAFYDGRALTVDWTGEAWRTQLGYHDTPIYTPYEAGIRLVELSRQYDFAFFPHWLTDLVGHRGTLDDGIRLLETFDGVMRGIFDCWNDDEGLVIITSDHGNLEEFGSRKHTENDVPTVIVGSQRAHFLHNFKTLADLVPRMAQLLFDADSN